MKKEYVQAELNTEQCVEVSLYMWNEYIKSFNKPQFLILSFPDWLKSLIKTK